MAEPTLPTDRPPDDEPDAATLRAARDGDASARAAVLTLIQDRLWRVCRGLLASDAAAEDAQQEAALRLLRGLPKFDGRSRLTTWATGIALNVCREQRRRTMRLVQDEPASQAFEAPPSADAEALAALRRGLLALPQRQREAVVLRYLEELSVRQTAELMGVADGTVKAAVHAGLRNLRAALGEDDARP